MSRNRPVRLLSLAVITTLHSVFKSMKKYPTNYPNRGTTMLSTKPVLPNFLKTLVITSMAFGSVAAFAGDDKKAEEIGDCMR